MFGVDYTAYADDQRARDRAVLGCAVAPPVNNDDDRSASPELGAITAPTLVISGAMDFCCGELYSKASSPPVIKGAVLDSSRYSGQRLHLEDAGSLR